jgi:hypothetical protein
MTAGLARAALLAMLVLLSIDPAAAQSAQPASGRLTPLAFKTGAEAAQPNVAAVPGAGFVVTWIQKTGTSHELWFAELDLAGTEMRRGRIARGRDWLVNWADFPSLAVLDNGDWVTFWLEQSAKLPYAYDIKLTRSTDRGRRWSRPVSPHTDRTATQHGFVSLLPDGADRVLVIWLDGRRVAELPASADSAHEHDEEAAPMTLRTAVLNRAGRLSGDSLLDDSTCSCCQTDAARWMGRVLVAYRDRTADEVRDIAVTARGIDGQWSKPRILHADNWRIEGCPVNGPALAVNGPKLLAVWPTLQEDKMIVRYQLREWDQPATTHMLETGERVRGRVDAAPWREGFLLSWLGGEQDGSGPRIGFLNDQGQLASVQRVSATSTSRSAGFLRMASLGERALLAWTAAAGEQSSVVQLVLLTP